MTDRIHEFLEFWFGNLGGADLPTSDRTNLWFGDNSALKEVCVKKFKEDYEQAVRGELDEWLKTPRGTLALIILYDQFSRYLYPHSDQAFSCDTKAQDICMAGIRQKKDHALTLIERVFFYMPLVHAEDTAFQENSIQLYQDLVTLSMSETTQIYQLFLAYAYAHFRVVKEFGRFPQRNRYLGRESTAQELAFLKDT